MNAYLSFGGFRALAGTMSAALLVDPEPSQGSSIHGLRDAATVMAKARALATANRNRVFVFNWTIPVVDARSQLAAVVLGEAEAYGYSKLKVFVSGQHLHKVPGPLVVRGLGAEVENPLLLSARFLAEAERLKPLADAERDFGFAGLVASLGNKTEAHVQQLLWQPPTPLHDHEACLRAVVAHAHSQRLEPPDWALELSRR